MNISAYYRTILPEGIIMSYKGAPSHTLLDSMLSIIDERLAMLESQSKLRKKVYHILIETIQNVQNHFDKNLYQNSQEQNAIIFILAKNDDGYSIITGNFIPNKDIANLKAHIDKINQASKDEIRMLYREQLHHGELSEKGGAGLGIIDIAKRSGEKLHYEFKDCQDGNSFFSLKVIVSA
ncbi:MAG: SiaB family protein kinase [Bernardetiaceae bacterium]|nr:SiaB family protein kinase [Bernardetiaceae bacterium]